MREAPFTNGLAARAVSRARGRPPAVSATEPTPIKADRSLPPGHPGPAAPAALRPGATALYNVATRRDRDTPAMARFCVKHLLALTITLVVVSFLVFALNEFSPGDVARKILGAYATQEQVALLTKEMGLDRPVVVRYVEYLGKLASGDLGFSTRFKVPVREIIWDRLRNTLVLAAAAFALIVPVSMLLGMLAGMREGSWLDRTILVFSTVAASVPEFAMGVFLASIFVVWLGWLPGTATLVGGGGWSVASQFVLPVLVIVLYDAGYVVSMVRASMVEVMQRPYIRTAVLKGMTFRRVVLGHALRNAMINPVTVICLQISYLVSGVVVVETVFAYPGFGRMILEAALFKDIALIEVGALVAVGVAILTQILGDLAYMLLDPRIRA
jgi:peptide/nickel transport system permease protein